MHLQMYSVEYATIEVTEHLMKKNQLEIRKLLLSDIHINPSEHFPSTDTSQTQYQYQQLSL